MYKLQSNTSYEFRVWANNYLGAGEAVTTVATTLSQLTDEQLFEILLRDVKEFDPIVWTYAVSVSMTALIILGCTVCFMLLRDHLEELEIKRQLQGKSARCESKSKIEILMAYFGAEEEEYTTISIVPNIILNPMCFDVDDPNDPSPPYSRTIIFGEDVLSSSGTDSDKEEPISFKRKVSLFFTGDTIKRL